MTTIEPTHASAVCRLIGAEPLDDAAQLKLARLLHQGRQDLVPPEMPARPSVLVADDHVLLDAYLLWSAGAKVSADRLRQLQYLAAWRVAVWDREAQSGLRLGLVLDAGQTFRRLGCESEATDMDLIAREAWGVRVEEAPRGGPWYVLRDWSAERAKRFDVLPLHLRTMRMPRGGVPLRREEEPAVVGSGRQQGGFGW